MISCAPTHGYKLKGSSVITEAEVKPIVNKNNSLLYKAKIDLYHRHYSGLIVLKQTDATTFHLTFVTEIGMKMFDYEIQNHNFKLVYVFEPLNKPRILALLESDMKLILLQHLLAKEAQVYEKNTSRIFKIKQGYRYYYKLNSGVTTVEKTRVKGLFFTKEIIDYRYDENLSASHIQLKHKGLIRLRIELTQINKPTSN